MKRCSENIQQIYRRTPMPKCDFNKVTLQPYSNRISAWMFSYKFAVYLLQLVSKIFRETLPIVTLSLSCNKAACSIALFSITKNDMYQSVLRIHCNFLTVCITNQKYCRSRSIAIIYCIQQCLYFKKNLKILRDINCMCQFCSCLTKQPSHVRQQRLPNMPNTNCVKSVRIQSYSGPYFPAFGLNLNARKCGPE